MTKIYNTSGVSFSRIRWWVQELFSEAYDWRQLSC